MILRHLFLLLLPILIHKCFLFEKKIKKLIYFYSKAIKTLALYFEILLYFIIGIIEAVKNLHKEESREIKLKLK
jgi:hypothetical protein